MRLVQFSVASPILAHSHRPLLFLTSILPILFAEHRCTRTYAFSWILALIRYQLLRLFLQLYF